MQKLPDSLEMQRIVSLKQAAELRGISEETLKRVAADKILQVSKRKRGMRVRDALLLEPA